MIDSLEELSIVPNDQETRYEEGLRVKKIVTCTTSQLHEAILKKIVDTNDKCNRIDRDDLKKKQGILNVLFKDATLPDFSLIWKYDKRLKKWVLAVNDGGHRSRTILEFMADKIMTGTDCYYEPDGITKEIISNKTYSELKNEHPSALDIFDNFELILTIQWNLSARQRKEDFDDRNESTKVEEQEKRNAHDDNVVAEWIRNTTKLVDGEDNQEMIHPLFNAEILGYKNTKMCWDEILTRILLLTTKKTVVTLTDNTALDNLYYEGSYASGDNGLYVQKDKHFKKMTSKALECCDFLYGVLSNWPTKKFVQKSNRYVTNALIRWYFTYKTDMENKNTTFFWNNEIKIDFKKFADEFHTLLVEKIDDESTGLWIKSMKKKRTVTEAFTGFLADFKDLDKITKSKDWIMESFNKNEDAFGITLYDARETFDSQLILRKWLENNKKDDLGNPIKKEDIRGDHDIPRSWGIKKGGVTEYSNLKILNAKDNGLKSNKMTFNEYKESKMEVTA